MKKRILSLLLAAVMLLLSGCVLDLELTESTSAETKGSSPDATTKPQEQSVPTTQKPVDSVPTEPVPTEPTPTAPIATAPTSAEPVPTEPTPTETDPTEPVYTEPTEPTEPSVVLELKYYDITLYGYGTTWNLYDGPLNPGEITWISNNEEVVTVANGVVTVVGNGTAMIIASYQDQIVSCIVRCADVEKPAEPQQYNITLWVSEYIVDLTKQQIAEFNETNPYGIYFNATVEPVHEADAGTTMAADVEAGADIFCFPQDQLARLVSVGALSALSQDAREWIQDEHSAGSVASATCGMSMYAYPLTADNGYYMYYDKSIFSETDIESLEAMIEKCERNGVQFRFALENGWYAASFFFATGCVSQWEVDANGKFVSVYDTFNSPEGIIACRGMQKLLQSSCYNSNADGIWDRSVIVTGTWNARDAEEYFGSNMGVADLPSFTVDGQSYHLGSFSGYKLLGVKPQADAERQAALHYLAQYLTNEACQMERFERTGWAPSNVIAQNSEAVQASPHLQAMFAQQEYSTAQNQIHGAWWDIAKMIASQLKSGVEPWMALHDYEAALDALFAPVDLDSWSVIGMIADTCWDVDLKMLEQADGTWLTTQAYYMAAGAEFKVRQGKSWDVNYGADGIPSGPNFVVEEAGYYYVLFDPSSGMIYLIEG